MPHRLETPSEHGLWERTYIPSFIRTVIRSTRRLVRGGGEGGACDARPARGEPRLMLRADGTIRCTACQLCAAVCPSQCIRVEADESVPPERVRRPAIFEIDLARCSFCGACVTACPCDALRMDTGRPADATAERKDLVYDLERLANNHPEGYSPLSRAL